MTRCRVVALAVMLAATVTPLLAQRPSSAVAVERSAYVEWLTSAPNSPLAAVAQLAVGSGIRLGPADADVPLEGVVEHRITERDGVVTLEGPDGARPLARGRPVSVGSYRVSAGGVRGRGVVTVHGPIREGEAAEFYPYDPGLVFVGPMEAALNPGRVRVLALDGMETDAAEVGSVTVRIGGRAVRLRVRRIPTGMADESDLEIYFRDATNGNGTYPAGRFVTLVPLGDGRYRLDFNRARNPFCAYNSVFPCPAPWRGNTIQAEVRAGERYLGGGLSTPPVGVEPR